MKIEQIDWTEVFEKALRQTQKVQVAFRPDGFKFDDVTTEIRFDLVYHDGLHIGTRVEITNRIWYSNLLTDEALKVYKYQFNKPCYTVAAFLQPRGYFVGTERNMMAREIFCALLFDPSEPGAAKFNRDILVPENIVRRESGPDAIALFWTKGLHLSLKQ